MSVPRRIVALGLALAAGGCAMSPHSSLTPACASSAAANRELVLDFYIQALVRKQVRAGFEKYVRSDFIEHKPDIQGGSRENVIRFLEAMVVEMPGAEWNVRRTVADGDFVALHVSFRPAPGAPEYAIADFFRLENCMIVEHWDVVAPPPAKASLNPNPRL
jgi:predicted SnoaL-like aldol condensation-catalyzing enzyme